MELLYLPTGLRELLWPYRAQCGWELAEAPDGGCYVRGFSEDCAPAIRGALLYQTRAGRLYLPGASLAERRAPLLTWRPLAEALPVSWPEAVEAPAVEVEPLALRLIPSETSRSATAQLVSADALTAFAKTAPAVRLNPLQFCVIDDMALLLGTPLLPLEGAGYWGDEHLLPLGFEFEFPELVNKIERRLRLSAGARAVWTSDGSYTTIPAACWQPLRRSNATAGRSETSSLPPVGASPLKP